MSTIKYLADRRDQAVEDWRGAAGCRDEDPDLFFPDKGKPTLTAKRVCATCPVQAECLRDAVDAGYVHGVWGGLSAKERKRLVVAERQRAVAHLIAETAA